MTLPYITPPVCPEQRQAVPTSPSFQDQPSFQYSASGNTSPPPLQALGNTVDDVTKEMLAMRERMAQETYRLDSMITMMQSLSGIGGSTSPSSRPCPTPAAETPASAPTSTPAADAAANSGEEGDAASFKILDSTQKKKPQSSMKRNPKVKPKSQKIFPDEILVSSTVEKREAYNAIDDIDELFEVFDEDGNGVIVDEELDFMLQRFDIRLDEEGIRMLIFKYNKPRREKNFRQKGLPQSEAGLDIDEFKRMMSIEEVTKGREGKLYITTKREQQKLGDDDDMCNSHILTKMGFTGRNWRTLKVVLKGHFVHPPESVNKARLPPALSRTSSSSSLNNQLK
jgi:hypothetical protein